MNQLPIVFMIMPFREEMLQVYEYLVKTFEEEFQFTNGGDLDGQRNILQDIVEGIDQADIVIADLTGLNANVFYELGLAHAMNKKVVCITQDISELPFDIRSYRSIEYSTHFWKIHTFVEELRKLLRGAIDGSIKYGNPVSDYAPGYGKTIGTPLKNNSVVEDETNESAKEEQVEDAVEAGYLDFIANIVDNTEKLTSELNEMNDEMHGMKDAFNVSSSEIARVKAQSGTASATFIRNTCRKLAEPIEACATKMNVHIQNINKNWESVENNYLDMLDNRFMRKAENKGSIQSTIETLTGFKDSISHAKANVGILITTLQDGIGLERRMNRAITVLTNELNAYLTMSDTIVSSIDRIIAKSETIIHAIT